MKYYKLHLIRHGLTEGNLKGLYIGSGSDLPLCAEGRAQLKTLKKDFGYPQVPLVFTSPMLRATQTAEILSLRPPSGHHPRRGRHYAVQLAITISDIRPKTAKLHKKFFAFILLVRYNVFMLLGG